VTWDCPPSLGHATTPKRADAVRSECSKTNTRGDWLQPGEHVAAADGAMFRSEHSLSIVNDPHDVTATLIGKLPWFAGEHLP
jgi:hypothetical protein